MEIKQGDIFRHDFGPRQNHLHEGPRPVVVIQTDILNALTRYPNVIVVPVTTKERPSATYAALQPSDASGLSRPSWAITNQIFTLDKGDLTQRLGQVSKEELYALKQAIKVSLDLP